MSIQRVVKRLQLGAVLVATAVPLVSQAQIAPPTVEMGCSKENTTTNIWCDAATTGGVMPYTYQWQVVDDFGSGPTSPYWYNGGTSLTQYCKFGLYTYGRYWTKYIRFRVIDANGYVSNVAEQIFRCWTPNN